MNARILSVPLACVLAAAAPAIAQPAPPPPPEAPASGDRAGERRGMFPSMSEAGRATVMEAMRSGGDRRDTRAKVEAARERMLAALETERFDAATVKRAMDEERSLSDVSRQQRQAALLAAFQKLSPADRRAFAADSRAMKNRMEQRVAGWRERWARRRGDAPRPDPE
jgi:uncharacterized membrane protein